MSHADGCLLFTAPPNRLDSLVQSQARELSQLRQQIKESRRLGVLQRRQLEELGRAFRELLEASKVDCYMGGQVKEQLDKSLSILDRLEGRLDKGSCCLAPWKCAFLKHKKSTLLVFYHTEVKKFFMVHLFDLCFIIDSN